MPNWVEQELYVVGPKADIDLFMRTGFRRGRRSGEDDRLLLERLCPMPRAERTQVTRYCQVLTHCRTHTDAMFWMQTAWEHPAAFYRRLPRYWPRLTCFASMNEELNQAGGVVVVMKGEVHDLVRDYDGKYNLRQHQREVRPVLRRLDDHILAARPWRLIPVEPWEHGHLPFDAWFAGDWTFYLPHT